MGPITTLPPFPDGWFFVCYSHELRPGKLLSKTFMGGDIVAFRSDTGEAAVLDAICPHLGAHMGKGGCVREGNVECPFHKFRFDQHGQCTHVPGSVAPKSARVKTWPVQEVNGMVLAYHDAMGRPPAWRIPALDLDGWSDLAHHHYRIKGHPQETTENGVDYLHLGTIHGYEAVQSLDKPTIEGPYLGCSFTMRREFRGRLRPLGLGLDVVFHAHVWGLGYSLVDITTTNLGLRVMLWSLVTPIDGEYVDLNVALRVRHLASVERLTRGHEGAALRWLRHGMAGLALKAYQHDIEQDFIIWENKRYMGRPMLARNDGPIPAYRRYCRQFYPQYRQDSESEMPA